MPRTSCLRPPAVGKAEVKRRADSRRRLDPDTTAVALHDALHDGETDSVALLDHAADRLIRRAVIQLKNARQLRGVHADAVVAYEVLDRPVLLHAVDLDPR